MTPIVYLASPLSGDVKRNQAYARACMLDSLRRGEAPFAPHLLYPQVLDDTDDDQREQGMRAGAAVLEKCHRFVAYTDLGWSRGMLAERALAEAFGRPVTVRGLDDQALEALRVEASR